MQQDMSRLFTKFFIVQFFMLLGTLDMSAQLYQHNFGTTTITTHPYTAAPVTIHPNLSNSSWTNSQNSWTSGVGAPPGQAIQVNTSAGTTSIYLKFNVTTNYQATITSFNFWRVRSNSGPQNWELLINNTFVATGTTPANTGAAVGVTTLPTPVNITGNATIELRLTNATGGWFRLDDFTLNGTVASTCSSIVISSFSPATGPAGTKVTILGNGFTGASAVKFNGVSSTNYTVLSNTEIEAILPSGGTTGKIDVFDAVGCNGSSSGNFSVMTSQCSTPQAPVPDIFISEVYDQKTGSGGMIEIYNPTASTITFNGQYRLLRYGDIEDTTPTAGYDLVMPGSIGPNSILLLYGTAPVQSICTTPPSTIQFGNGFNGNDKFELLKNNVVIDVAHITSAAAGFTTRRKPTAIAPKNVFNSADWDIVVHGTNPDPSYCADLGVFNLPTPPTVTPIATKTICAGASTTFTATLSNPTGYSYQWKTLNAAGNWVNVTNGANFSGATSTTLSVIAAPASLDDTQYYCEMTSSNCNVKSTAAQLYVINLDPPILSQTPPTCTTATGTITVQPVTGATYSNNGTTFQSSNIFNGLAPGPYSITIKVGNCTASDVITVDPAPGSPATPQLAQTPPTCTVATGTITVTLVAGLEYSLDGGAYQSSNIFTGVNSGSHTVTVKNAAGCTASNTITVDPAPGSPATPQLYQTPPTCTVATGTITVTPIAGLEYSLDGSAYQASNIFTGVNSGLHTVTVKNAAGCTASNTITVDPAPGSPTTPQLTQTPPTCTVATGTITVTPVAGVEYSLDGGTYQSSNIFTGVNPGSHTVTVKNAAGCTASNTITVDPAPASPQIVNIVIQHPTCTTAFGTIIVNAQGTGLEYSIGALFQANNQFSNLAPGTYNITVKNADGCEDFGTAVINAVPLAPAQPVATPVQPTCSTSGSISVNPIAGVEYSLDGGPYQTSNIFNNVSQGTHIITVRNAANCTNASDPVTINAAPAQPNAPILSQTPPTCTTSTGSIIVLPVAGLEYKLDSGAYQASNQFANVNPGQHTVTVRNADGCTASGTITVGNAPAIPSQPQLSQMPPVCNGTFGRIIVTPASGLEYSLDGGAYQASNEFNNVTPGLHTIRVRNTDGCEASNSITVGPAPAVPSKPFAAATQPTCAAPTAAINVTPVAGTGITYSINGITFQSAPVFNNVSGGTYTVTVKNAAGCTNVSDPVVVNPAPAIPSKPVAVPIQPTCTVPNAIITVNPIVGTGIMYSLNGGTYQVSNIFNAPAGTYTITVRNAAGCTNVSDPVIINTTPLTPSKPGATAIQPNCTNADGRIIVTPQSGTGITYSLNGGPYQASNLFNNLPSGTYVVTVKNSGGCTNTSDPMIINPAPALPDKPVAIVTQPTCANPVAEITVNPVAGTGITYSLNGVAYQASNTFGNVAGGTYTITVKNAYGCTQTSDPVTVNTAPTQSNAGTINGNSDVCEGSVLQLSNTATGGTWSISNTAIATINQNGLLTALAPGTVTVTYDVQGQCPALVSKVITIYAKPEPTLLPEYYLCVDNVTGAITPKVLNSGLTGTGYTYLWRRNGSILPVNTSSIVVIEPGTYTVTATNTITGCTAGASTIVGTSSIAVATASIGFDFENFQTINVNVIGGSGDYEYSLDLENWQNEAYFRDYFEGEYTIYIRDKHGCGTAEVEILALNYPRFFTPNGDGVNDTWNITGVYWQKTKIYIFDRYGKLIAEVKPGVLGWDGTFNGNRLPATDYWFTMKYISRSGEGKELKAHFTLKR